MRILRPHRHGDGIALRDCVIWTVDLHIQPGRKHMLMNVADDPRRHLGAEFSRFTRPATRRVDNPGSLHLVFNAPILVQIPVRRIFVIPNR